jgi:hypothetical protein
MAMFVLLTLTMISVLIFLFGICFSNQEAIEGGILGFIFITCFGWVLYGLGLYNERFVSVLNKNQYEIVKRTDSVLFIEKSNNIIFETKDYKIVKNPEQAIVTLVSTKNLYGMLTKKEIEVK